MSSDGASSGGVSSEGAIGPGWPARAPSLRPLRVLSLMSGTSLDGMDGVVAHLDGSGDRLSWDVEARASAPYPYELRRRLVTALEDGTSDALALTQLHAEIGHAYAEFCGELCDRHQVGLIALSGQNVYHVPRVDASRGWRTVSTLQLGEAAQVLERCRVPVACDFRQSDLAAGGQGAPLVSFGDLKLYALPGVARAVHNLGGISNLTYLPPDGDPVGVIAFDTGPGNCLIDEAATSCAGLEFDEDGRLGAAGRIDQDLLDALLAHPYLALPYPKTTGRELFSLGRVFEDVGRSPAGLDAPDLIATLTAFTAASVAAAYRTLTRGRPLDEVLLAGGGASNPTLVAMLRSRLDRPVRTFEELGMISKDREALAFAVMAYYGYHGFASTLPAATGARRAVVAGKFLWPEPLSR